MSVAAVQKVAELRSQWKTLSSLDKADRIQTILASGMKGRALARELKVSEGLIRHLAIAASGDPYDRAQALKRLISTRELVRRIRSRRTSQAQFRRAANDAEHAADALHGAAEIVSWLGQHLAPAYAEQVLDEARRMLIRAEQNGSLPRGHAPAVMRIAEIIRRCRPTDLMNRDLSFVEGYSRWLALWTFYCMPDGRIRERAFQIAWTKVIRQ